MVARAQYGDLAMFGLTLVIDPLRTACSFRAGTAVLEPRSINRPLVLPYAGSPIFFGAGFRERHMFLPTHTATRSSARFRV
jgi:hypothetical protein